MASEFGVQGLGDFLEWPPTRYLPEGFYQDPAKTEIRRDLLGIYAIKAAFRFRYEGVSNEQIKAYAEAVKQAAAAKPADGPALQAAMEALAKVLLAEPFVSRLYLYDFFSDSAPFIKDARDFEAFARHVEVLADRLVIVDALATADPGVSS